MDYATIKSAVEAIISSPNQDALAHVHGGMAVLLLARVVTRRSLATPIPLLCVLIVQVINECIDRQSHGSWRWPDTLADTFNTLLWPTVLFLGLRYRKHR